MITIDSATYREIANSLRSQIADTDYYSGSIHHSTPDYDATLTSTLIVYRSTHTAPDRTFTTISDVVPVWWSCSTTTDEGERLNDFDFNRVRKLLIDRK
ncbi:MAG: hypothetical protein IJ014_07180 [Rikenellaceae bacterium]|nr:hypothetical protein [Rikenellaceae bacterium]